MQHLLRNAMTTEVTTLQLLRCASDSALDFVDECFPSLKSLSLCFYLGEGIPRNSITLPESVRDVYFYFGTPPTQNQDPPALAMLHAHPHVCGLSFTYSQAWHSVHRTDAGHPSQLSFKKTRKYATKHDVELTVSEVETPPHLLDF